MSGAVVWLPEWYWRELLDVMGVPVVEIEGCASCGGDGEGPEGLRAHVSIEVVTWCGACRPVMHGPRVRPRRRR